MQRWERGWDRLIDSNHANGLNALNEWTTRHGFPVVSAKKAGKSAAKELDIFSDRIADIMLFLTGNQPFALVV